ncbi:MAG: hypothetical protein ABI543_05780 [Ignavibacteria bacterium]
MNLQIVFSQGRFKKEKLLFEVKKELIKSLKIRSKSAYVYVRINNKLIEPKSKNYAESCLFDSNGNKSEDYYSFFDGKTYKMNYFYNKNGSLSQVVRSILNGKEVDVTNYYYDDNNNLIKESASSGDKMFKNITTYEYDVNNILIKKISHGDHEIIYQYEYDSFGNLINTIENNWFEKTHNYSSKLTYNADSMVTECRNFSDGILQSTFTYKYINKINIIEQNIHWEEMHKDQKSIYKYDEKGNVITSKSYEGDSMIFNSRFKYDLNGLLIEKINLDSNDNEASIYKYIYEY